MKKIGIPRALLYHRYHPAWNKFFTELDFEVVNSIESNSDIMSRGVKIASDEVCVPVKLFLGHVDYLKDKVNYLFIPRLVSVEKNEYICPKFMGLPDLVQHCIDDLPEIVSPVVNLRDKKFSLIKNVYDVAKEVDKNLVETFIAFSKAAYDFRKYKREQLKRLDEDKDKIAVLGHEYIIYDKHISMDLINKLEKMDIQVITPEVISEAEIKKTGSNKFDNIFWTFGRKMMETAHYFLKDKQIDGIIQLTAFGCGPDSLVGEMIERRSKQKKPFMTLNLDEHTGEAGLVTRLEAFLDMIRRG